MINKAGTASLSFMNYGIIAVRYDDEDAISKFVTSDDISSKAEGYLEDYLD